MVAADGNQRINQPVPPVNLKRSEKMGLAHSPSPPWPKARRAKRAGCRRPIVLKNPSAWGTSGRLFGFSWLAGGFSWFPRKTILIKLHRRALAPNPPGCDVGLRRCSSIFRWEHRPEESELNASAMRNESNSLSSNDLRI